MKDLDVIHYTETNDYKTYRVRASTTLQAKIIAYLADCKDRGTNYEFNPTYWDVVEPPGVPKIYTIDDVDNESFLKLHGKWLTKDFYNKNEFKRSNE